MEKPADIKHPVIELIRRRWSPVAFSDRPVQHAKLLSIFEAARWAASSYNEQPWRFLVALKEDAPGFAKALSCIVEANQIWARHVPVLVLTCAKTHFQRGNKPNRVHQHDLGIAAAQLTLQAMELGLFVHQMAGVDPAKVRSAYAVPEGFEPQTAIAIGYPGRAEDLDEAVAQRDLSPRSRLPLEQIIFADTFGRPADWVKGK